jgi:hypothetical protein
MIRRTLHRYTDLALTSLLRSIRLYEDGFGDRAALERLVEAVRTFRRDDPLPELDVRWGPARRVGRVLEQHARFTSPSPDLPVESRVAPMLWLEPAPLPAPLRDPVRGDARPDVVVLLAMTGEEGYFGRRRFASALLERGLAVLIVENPFYGARRPRGQLGPSLRTVRDQFAMNYATVVEGRAIAAWLRARGHRHVVLSGYSQGGIMAAFVSALVPFPTGCVPRGAGATVEAIFTEGALSRAMRWDKLAAELGGRDSARAYFERCLAPVRVDLHPPPLETRAAIVVGAHHDAFVPPSAAEALHRHWPGSELRWDDAGHVTAAVLGQRAHQRAVLDAMGRLREAS